MAEEEEEEEAEAEKEEEEKEQDEGGVENGFAGERDWQRSKGRKGERAWAERASLCKEETGSRRHR